MNPRKKKISFLIVPVFAVFMIFAFPAFAETLRIMEWEGYMPEKFQKQFIQVVKEKFGVDLKLDIRTVNQNDEFFPALRDQKVDLVTPSHHVLRDSRYQLIKHRLVLPLNLANIPNYKKVIPALQKANYCTEDGKVYAVPVARGLYGLAYNTSLFPEPPKSWNIFWDPRFQNKYVIGKFQYEENIYNTALAMGFSRDALSSYKKLNTPEFQNKLAQLVSRAHGMWEGVDKPEDLKGLYLGTSWGDSLVGLRKMGEIWKMAEPVEGTLAWVDNFMISSTLENKPKLKQIAEEYLNIILSDEYQVYLTMEVGNMPIVSSIADKLPPEEIERCHLNDPGYFEKNLILNPTLGKLDRRGFKRLWEKALKSRK